MGVSRGWYEAPGRPGYLRFWDGEHWTSGFAELSGPSDEPSEANHPYPDALSPVEAPAQQNQTSAPSTPLAVAAPHVSLPAVATESGTFNELARIFDWTGRTAPGPYWGLAGINFVVWTATFLSNMAILLVPAALVSLAFISATVRRLRDGGVAPVVAILMFVPLLWPIVLIYCSRPSITEGNIQPRRSPQAETSSRPAMAPIESRSRSVGELNLFCATCVRHGGVIGIDDADVDATDSRWQFLLIRPEVASSVVVCRDCHEFRWLDGILRKNPGQRLTEGDFRHFLAIADKTLATRSKRGEPVNVWATLTISQMRAQISPPE